MPWPVPAPGQIASRAASVYEESLPGIDARSPNTVATTNTRITEMAMLDLYLYVAYIANELMPDTAQDWLPRHAIIWGVPQVQAAPASGNAIAAGAPESNIPAGLGLSYQGTSYVTTAAVEIPSSGQASVPVEAVVAGTAGNLAAGAILTVTTPVEGLGVQQMTVDPNDIAGGLEAQSIPEWRQEILAKIRTEPSGGDYDDYVQWAQDALPGVIAACPAAACGQGAVAVFIAMVGPTGPIAATAEQVATVQAYINTQGRPVTANVTVYAATLNPINFSLQVRPNTAAIQAAAEDALALFFAQQPAASAAASPIGQTSYFSQLEDAIAADGETYHEILAPTADVPAPNLGALNVLGTVTFS